MGTQKQFKDSNCYNNRYVLKLIFIAVFILVPLLLIIGDNGLCFSSGLSNANDGNAVHTNWWLKYYSVIAASFSIVLLFLILNDKRKKSKQEFYEDLFYNNYQIKNIIEKTITKEIKAKINSIDITKQTVQAAIEEGIIAHVRDGINSAMTKCVESEVVSQISEINIPKESVKRKIEESINEFLNDKVLMEKVVASVLRNSEFMNVVSTSIVKNTCDMNLIKSTFEEVIKEQFLEVYDRDICDRSFAVQIIDTISKNEKLNAVQINFIKSILDKVFYTNN